MSTEQPSLARSPLGETEIDLMDLFRTIWRGKFFILLCVVVAILFGGWYAFIKATPIYRSTAVLALENEQEQVGGFPGVVPGLSGDQSTINTEIEVMKSRGLIEKLVIELDLLNDPEFNAELRPEPKFSLGKVIAFVKEGIFRLPSDTNLKSEREILDRVIDEILKSIAISNKRQSLVFNLSFTMKNPEKSARMANTLARLYIQDQLDVKFEATQKATEWLAKRATELQIELENAEAAVKAFDAQTVLVSPEALFGLNRQIKDLRDRFLDAVVEEEKATARVQALEAAENTGDLTSMIEVAQDAALTRLAQNTDDNTLNRENVKVRFAQVFSRAELELQRASGQVAALKQSISDLETRIAAQSDDLVKLQQLQREAEAAGLIYETVLQRLKETTIQRGTQRADSRVISNAVTPRGAVAPRKSMILALTVILGGLLGAGIVLLKEMTQNTFRQSEELEKITGATVIGQVPIIPEKLRKNTLKYLLEKPTSAVVEAIRNLRTSLLLSDIDNPPQVILSTSSVPGEGKTTISLSLAQNLSGLGKKVLLVEADIRRCTFSEYFDTSDKKSLISVVSNGDPLEEALFQEPMMNVDILIGEKATTNATDFFSSNRFKAFLEEVRHKYDYIIIDAPPVLAVPDARVIGQMVDAVIYTVKWDSTTQPQVKEGLKSLVSVKVPVAGVILNQINSKKMKGYGYGESYGAYGSYYDT